jgi:GH15 family glucan-1,4-alpha-glucosidase
MTVHKYNMGIVGNCSLLAYIDDIGAVRWLCLPRYDSSYIFGSLIDGDNGGEFRVRPSEERWSSRQFYLQNTNILCTEFETGDGRFRVTDFAPRFYQYERYFRPLMLIRKIEPLKGEPIVKVSCTPRGNYGKLVPEIAIGSNHLSFLGLESTVRLTTDIPVTYIAGNRPFVLNGTRYLVFTWGVPLEAPLAETAESFLEKTRLYWLRWIKTTSIGDVFQEEIIRSALVLKLHQFEDTGAIIASGTTSLPESQGSVRTWDYRYCWLRDSFYILQAFNNIGHFEELEKYFYYIQDVTLNNPQDLQPLFGLGGEWDLKERQIECEGYLGNHPVRIGNAAAMQKQFDAYGLLIASLAPLYSDRRLDNGFHRQRMGLIGYLLRSIAKSIGKPDAGIWEFRNSLQINLYTNLCHWVGGKAARKLGLILDDSLIVESAEDIIRRSSGYIEQCYRPELNAYTQAVGIDHLDASSLNLILFGYLDPRTEKAAGHVRTLRQHLRTSVGIFRRYSHSDDFGEPQTGFLVCGFWYAEALACIGAVDEAVEVVTQLVKSANHLGLLSEDADGQGGQWGNFPQTYSHVGLMNAAYRIARKQDKLSFM